jgi:hypothetical protein
MFKPTPTDKLVEIKPRRAIRQSGRQRRLARWKAVLCGLFGLWSAVVWHFIHLASEPYLATPESPHFWIHLLFEGFLAVYAAGLLYVVLGMLERK